MLPENQELSHYVLKAHGITRVALNIMFIVCLFIFPWLILVAYYNLGKGKQGWAYFIPYVFFNIAAQSEPSLVLVALIIHVAAWVHANKILTDYQRLAQLRLVELDQKQNKDVDVILEKGIILHKVFCDRRYALEVLNQALPVKDGDAYLLNQAGNVMFEQKKFQEAAVFFNRAYSVTNDFQLTKQLNKNLKRIERKMGKVNYNMKVFEMANSTSAV